MIALAFMLIRSATAAEPDPAGFTPWIPTIVAGLLAVIGGVFAILNRRGGERARRQPTWVELTTENRLLRDEIRAAASELRAARTEAAKADDLDRDLTDLRRDFEDYVEKSDGRAHLFALVLEAAAEQWPADHPGPSFAHILNIEQIDDTLPKVWRRNPADA